MGCHCSFSLGSRQSDNRLRTEGRPYTDQVLAHAIVQCFALSGLIGRFASQGSACEGGRRFAFFWEAVSGTRSVGTQLHVTRRKRISLPPANISMSIMRLNLLISLMKVVRAQGFEPWTY
ncbi:hypothetical protein AGR1A_Cc40249 [Agrobacterium fabacearum CFBP 5771]|nr:hypothetical protein AGR1A_Cc40249 [Agrobacterium fabacearum CFBP 5771]